MEQRGPQRPHSEWEIERKFVTAADPLHDFVRRIERRTTLEVYDEVRPVTWNRTTYLDTDDLSYLRSARTGGIARKLRIREYASAAREGEPPEIRGPCWLELKESGGWYRTKTRAAADAELIARLLGPESGRPLAEDLEKPLRVFERTLREERPTPRLTTWYRRITRVSPDRLLRITIDSELCFARPVAVGVRNGRAAPHDIVASPPFSIVEVKSAGDWGAWLADALAPLAEVRQFSKYEQGMMLLQGGGLR